jgi:hypothetical protein
MVVFGVTGVMACLSEFFDYLAIKLTDTKKHYWSGLADDRFNIKHSRRRAA